MPKKSPAEEAAIGSDVVTLGPGQLEDYLTGKPVQDKPEERVRQLYLRRLVEEYGYPKTHMVTEFPIHKGSQLIGPADIAIFHSEVHDLSNVYILVENKREERTDGVEQLQSYLGPTKAPFGVWFNGIETEALQALQEAPYFRPIPDIPQFGQTLEDVGIYNKEDLEPATELRSIFESIHNYIFANQGLLKDATFNEILKLLFVKLVDEKSSEQTAEFRITDEELTQVREGRKSNFTTRIDRLFERVKREYKDVFRQEEELRLKSDCLAYAVSQLQKYSLSRTQADVKGTAFQTFVGAYQRGDRGEFFTPNPVLQLAVEMMNPRSDEFLIDPACGSGGFLVEGLRHVIRNLKVQRSDMSEAELKDAILRYARTYLRGIDFNPDLAKVAKMYMVLYDDGHTGIFSADSLSPFDEIDSAAVEAGSGHFEEGTFDVLITNPPFGTDTKIRSRRILEQFRLGREWKKDGERRNPTGKLRKGGQTPEALFVERSVQLLKPGGRMALVLPDGILTNPSLRYIRDFLSDECDLVASVSLPDGTFLQAGVNPKTSILIAVKKGGDRKVGPDVFMCELDRLGYDLKKKTAPMIFKRDNNGELIRDQNGDPVPDSEVSEAVRAFDSFKRNWRCWF